MRRRPSPERVREILGGLMGRSERVGLPDLVRAIVTKADVSRASAYRSARDAVESGVIGYEEDGVETKRP